MTSVRCKASVGPTPGWAPPEGSRLASDSMWNPEREEKRRLAYEPSAEERRMAKRRDCNGGAGSRSLLEDLAVINDGLKLARIREILKALDPRYARVAIRARGDRERILVNLSGEGACVCRIAGREHSHSTVFMQIRRKGDCAGEQRERWTGPTAYEAVMKCHSAKCRGQRSCGYTLPHTDGALLFPMPTARGAARRRRGAAARA